MVLCSLFIVFVCLFVLTCRKLTLVADNPSGAKAEIPSQSHNILGNCNLWDVRNETKGKICLMLWQRFACVNAFLLSLLALPGPASLPLWKGCGSYLRFFSPERVRVCSLCSAVLRDTLGVWIADGILPCSGGKLQHLYVCVCVGGMLHSRA